MKTFCSQNTDRKRFLAIMLFGLLALLLTAENATAQSTDRDNPTPLTAKEIRGTGINKQVEYYYSLLAGPGEVILTSDVRAKSGSTFFEAELFNMDAERIDLIRYGPTSISERKIVRPKLAQQQPVLLRIVLDSSAGDYMVRVGGAVQVDSAATLSPTPIASDASTPTTGTPASTPPATSTESIQPVATAETPVTTTDATATPQPTDGKMSGSQKLWLRLGGAGEMLGLAKIGKLKIEMKDGTSQEIGLLKVKKLFAPKGEDPASASPSNESWQRLWMKLGNAGELMNLASSGAMRVELQDGSTQQFDLTKIKKVSIKK